MKFWETSFLYETFGEKLRKPKQEEVFKKTYILSNFIQLNIGDELKVFDVVGKQFYLMHNGTGRNDGVRYQ